MVWSWSYSARTAGWSTKAVTGEVERLRTSSYNPWEPENKVAYKKIIGTLKKWCVFSERSCTYRRVCWCVKDMLIHIIFVTLYSCVMIIVRFHHVDVIIKSLRRGRCHRLDDAAEGHSSYQWNALSAVTCLFQPVILQDAYTPIKEVYPYTKDIEVEIWIWKELTENSCQIHASIYVVYRLMSSRCIFERFRTLSGIVYSLPS